MKATYNASFLFVTPEIATEWLEQRNKNNRPLNQAVAIKYANQMRDGKWVYENGDTITFDSDGTLIDGQHRLWAIAKSGVPMRMIIVNGASSDAFHSKDIGKKRSGGDVLSCIGFKDSNRVAAACRVVYAVFEYGDASIYPPMSNREVQETAEKHPGLSVWAANVGAKLSSLNGVPAGAMTGFMYLFSLADSVKADSFFHKFTTGAELHCGDPILTLRNTLARCSARAGASPFLGFDGKAYLAQLIVQAWNAHCEGRPLTILRRLSGSSPLKIAKLKTSQ